MKTIVSRTHATPLSPLGLATSVATLVANSAKEAFREVARGFGALVSEHSRALLAATKAALPRTRLDSGQLPTAASDPQQPSGIG